MISQNVVCLHSYYCTILSVEYIGQGRIVDELSSLSPWYVCRLLRVKVS